MVVRELTGIYFGQPRAFFHVRLVKAWREYNGIHRSGNFPHWALRLKPLKT